MTLTQSHTLGQPSLSQEPKVSTPVRTVALLDRDHSILAFNERVLDWAYRKDVPLIERLRYLCIVSSNLDEFFEVRAELHLAASQALETKGVFTVESFEKLAAAAHSLVTFGHGDGGRQAAPMVGGTGRPKQPGCEWWERTCPSSFGVAGAIGCWG